MTTGHLFHELGDLPKLEPVSAPPAIDTGSKYEPGIYFGMPEEEYHAIPALSASGIKNLMISNMDFWALSWMNPDGEEKETSALSLGTAYGVRICEGKDAFYRQYTYAFDRADHPKALDTVEQMDTALKELGETSPGKLKNKAGRIKRLLELAPDVEILEVLKEQHAEMNEGMQFLSAHHIREIEIAARIIELDPAASRCFQGGYPEVVIIWRDEGTGVLMKARVDYLKIKAIVDLKSFSNPLGKSISNAISSAMASRKYHIQSAVYDEAVEHGARFAREGKVHGEVDPAWIEAFAIERERRTFYFVWQQTGIAPVTRVKEFSHVLELFKVAQAVVGDAKEKFAQCWHHYGPENPWLDIRDIEQFEDVEFPLYILEA